MEFNPAELSRMESHELFMSAIVPRPIAFVSTIGEDGVYNVAPFSCFAQIGLKPPLVCLYVGRKREGQKKDTLRNIESSGAFVVNVVDEPLAEAMNQTSGEYPLDVDEFEKAGLIPEKADLVNSPMIAESPVKMECRVLQILSFGKAPKYSHFVIGSVLRVHVKDELWIDGIIKNTRLDAIGRLGEDLQRHGEAQ